MAPKAKLNTSLPAKPSSAGSQGSNRDQKAKAAPKVSDRPSASKLSGSPEGNATSTAPPEVKSSKSTAAAASSESFVQARPTLKGPLSTGGKSVIKKPKPKPVVEEGPKLDTEEDFDWGKSGGWTVDKWCESLELHTIIASALDVPEDSPFEHVKKLTKQQISEQLRQPALLDGLIEQLVLGVEMLQSRAAASAEELNKKFQMDGGGFEMAFGSLDLFFGGLEGVIGPPQMIDGSLHKAMKAEHTTYKDSNKEFKSANGVTTTSAIEWELVAEPDLQKAYPDRPYFTAAVQARAEARAAAEAAGEALPPLEGAFASASPSHEFGRSPMAVEAFEALVEEQNARLRKHNLVEIILVEALAGRLCTRPLRLHHLKHARRRHAAAATAATAAAPMPLLLRRCRCCCAAAAATPCFGRGARDDHIRSRLNNWSNSHHMRFHGGLPGTTLIGDDVGARRPPRRPPHDATAAAAPSSRLLPLLPPAAWRRCAKSRPHPSQTRGPCTRSTTRRCARHRGCNT